MSSPLIIKKARASLKSSISDFLDVEEFSPDGKSGSHISFDNPPNFNDFIEELGDKRSESPLDAKEEFTEKTCERINIMISQLNLDPELKTSSRLRILRRTPISIQSSPETYKPSKYFQKVALHESEDLILFNLENQIQMISYGHADFRFAPFGTKAVISAATIGTGKLKDIIIYSDFASKLNLRHFESKSVSRSWNLPNDQTASQIKMKEELIYCGMSSGKIILYDLRMKAPLTVLQGAEDPENLNIFDPVTSIESWEDYKLMTSSSSNVSIWDLRSSQVVASHITKHNRIPKANLIDPNSATVAFYSNNLLCLQSFEDKQSIEIKIENPIEDICYIPKLREILVLAPSGETEGFVKTNVHVYSIEKGQPYLLDTLNMTEEYSHLEYSSFSDKLIAISTKHLSVWNFYSKDDERIIKKYFKPMNN